MSTGRSAMMLCGWEVKAGWLILFVDARMGDRFLRVIHTDIRIRIRDPRHHQNLIICSMAHCQHSLKISCKSVQKFLSKVGNRQTKKQRRLDNLLGGDNKRPAYLLRLEVSVMKMDYCQ